VSKINVLTLSEQIPDEASAYEYLEGLRWNGSPECPHCGNEDRCYFLTPKDGPRTTSTGAATQRRLWKCAACRKKFSVLTGTVMHGTKIPVRTWVFVMFEMAASKNGVSAREIERKYGVTNRSAWFLAHRIREAMKAGGITVRMTGTVVADETFIGGKPSNRHGHKSGQGWSPTITDKTPVLTLIDAATGESRSRVIPKVTGRNLRAVMEREIDFPAVTLHTDSAAHYKPFRIDVKDHESVNHHQGEYVRDGVSTNKAENFFSQLKRSLDGTHHHVSVEHLARYLAEYDFRYGTRKISDAERFRMLVSQTANRRLTYRSTSEVDGLVA
jgi:transposase-like protein